MLRQSRSIQKMVRGLRLKLHISSANLPAIVYINNHTAVWGSWYDATSGEWGYACCHSVVHVSYCTGLAGIEATQASSAKHLLASSLNKEASPPPESAPRSAETTEDRKKKAEELFSKKRLGEGEINLDKDRLAQALQEEKKRKGRSGDDDDRHGKRQKGQSGSYEVSQEELGEFCLGAGRWLVDSIPCRGVQDEPPDDGGPDGQLCRCGGVAMPCYICAPAVSLLASLLIVFLYAL